MKRILLLLLSLWVLPALYAQEGPFYPGSLYNNNNPFYSRAGTDAIMPSGSSRDTGKPDVGVQLGTSFSTDFNKGHAFSTMVSPTISYRVGKRLNLRGGMSVSNTEYGNTLVYSPYGFGRYSGNITQGMLYVGGDFLISPGVILSGTAYKEFSIGHEDPENIYRPGYDGKGLMMNLRLMPGKNTTIDVGAEIYQGNNPWRGGTYNPFYQPFGPGW
jgi:hypothetical protein